MGTKKWSDLCGRSELHALRRSGIERIQMPKDDENSILFEVLQRLTKIETNTEDPLL